MSGWSFTPINEKRTMNESTLTPQERMETAERPKKCVACGAEGERVWLHFPSNADFCYPSCSR